MASTDVRGYLPPDGPRNSHAVPYSWMSGQDAHRVGNVVVYSPESVILTTDEDAQRTLDGYDLDEVPQDVAASALDALANDGDANAVVDEWRSDREDVAGPADERPTIPSDSELAALPYRGDSDSEDADSLQDLAQAWEITATQSADDLRTALAAVRDEEEEASE